MTLQTLDALRAGRLAGARELKLCCGLEQFPREILTLADTLEVLDLSGNALTELPDELAQLKHLRIIFCSDNRFTRLPEVLGRCGALGMVGFKANRITEVPAAALPPALRWLILTDNAIEVLPEAIGDCAQLQKLMLAGNRLRTLPAALWRCQRLELLRIAANALDVFPDEVLRLPRLAWLAYAGNPFCAALETEITAGLPESDVAWSQLQPEALLGEGASGVIYRAQRADLNPVAVKLFKGVVTSDGLPQCEMAAALHAGSHPNLIPVQGRVAAHPDGTPGLVMDLIDPVFRNLAGPPSRQSCTRDVYAEATRFSVAEIWRLAAGVASAAAHLHRRGILHGDLYAHNILHDGDGRALIGDFGAASFYRTQNRALADALQRIEVRAFGCLLEELLARAPAELPGRAAALSLCAACLQHRAQQRPAFDEIVETLKRCAETDA